VNIRMHTEARMEMVAASKWYEGRVPDLGMDFLGEIEDAFAALLRQPHGYTPLMTAGREVRRYILSRFPYAVVYEVRANELVVLAIAHARRRSGYWRRRDANP
jgi:toxin ParE1/3/4